MDFFDIDYLTAHQEARRNRNELICQALLCTATCIGVASALVWLFG